jgi:hypothetical protein
MAQNCALAAGIAFAHLLLRQEAPMSLVKSRSRKHGKRPLAQVRALARTGAESALRQLRAVRRSFLKASKRSRQMSEAARRVVSRRMTRHRGRGARRKAR